MKIIEAKFGKKAMDGLADDLRKLAAAVDRGEIVDLVSCFIENGEFCYLWGASLYDSSILSDLLHAQAISRMRE